jgi:glycosyltransferase involved in cell wall biosynthesis
MTVDTVLSIVIPVYNSEKFLTHCVDSVLAQSYSAFECILVDDGSTDSSPAICDEYAAKDNRVKVIHRNNSGVSSARNEGIRAAAGKYLAFVDSDDYILPGMYGTMVNMIETQQTGTVCSAYHHQGRDYFFPGSFEYGSIAAAVYHLERYSLFGLIWNKIYILEIIRKKNIYCPAGYWFGEDMFFNLQYFNAINSVSFINTPFYEYRENTGSITGKRPSFDQSINRFRNVTSQIVKLADNECFINKILALDFSYVVFAIRFLYYPEKSSSDARKSIMQEIKGIYREHPALPPFRSLRYVFFYHLIMRCPFCIFDCFAPILFWIAEYRGK